MTGGLARPENSKPAGLSGYEQEYALAKSKQDAIDEQLNADAPTVYSNAVALSASPYDLTFVFGLRIGDTVQPQSRVVMSLEHAMVVLMITRRTLREHQRNTGVQIKVPDAVLRDLQLDEEDPLW